MPRDQYEEVRSESTHFIVAEGHDVPKFERVVEKRRGYAVVQKVMRRLAALVKRTDPRNETA